MLEQTGTMPESLFLLERFQTHTPGPTLKHQEIKAQDLMYENGDSPKDKKQPLKQLAVWLRSCPPAACAWTELKRSVRTQQATRTGKWCLGTHLGGVLVWVAVSRLLG